MIAVYHFFKELTSFRKKVVSSANAESRKQWSKMFNPFLQEFTLIRRSRTPSAKINK